MPVSLPFFPTAQTPSSGEPIVGSMPASLSGGLTETASFDAQMAALSPAAAETVVVPAAAGLPPVPTTSVTVFARPEALAGMATSPACAEELALFPEECLPTAISGEPAPAPVDDSDEGTAMESDDATSAEGEDTLVSLDASRLELIAAQQPAAMPVRAAPVHARQDLEAEPSGVAGGDVTLAGGEDGMPTSRGAVRMGGQAVSQPSASGAGASLAARTVDGMEPGVAQPAVVPPADFKVSNESQVWPETVRAMPRDVFVERVGAQRVELPRPVQLQAATSTAPSESSGATPVSGKTSLPGEVTAMEASNVARVLQSTSSQEALPTAKAVDAPANSESDPAVAAEANSAGVVPSASVSARGVPVSFVERKILNSGYKALADDASVAGIAGAKRYRAMISDITSTAGSMTPNAEHAVAGAVSAVAQGLQVADVAATEAMAPVSRAFEAVQDAVENLKASRQNVVEVTLSEGQDSPLHIRIEYRDGVVHTAFRTESRELREHLARDWQSSMSGLTTTDSGVRLADPVFSTPTSSSRDAGLDMGGQYARQQQSQQSPSQTTSSSGGLRHAGSETSSAASSVGSSAAPQSARPETARYLHTLA